MAFKRRLKFDKRIKHKKRMDRLFILVILCFAFLGIGYSYISTSLNINGTANVTAASWDVHFDNLNVTDGSVTATTPASITSTTTVEFSAELAEPNDFYEFTVDVVNSGTMDAMIDSISITPTLTEAQKKYLKYTVTYDDGTDISVHDSLAVNSSEKIKVHFEYLESENKTDYPTEDISYECSISLSYAQGEGTARKISGVIYRYTNDNLLIGDSIIATEGTHYKITDGQDVLPLRFVSLAECEQAYNVVYISGKSDYYCEGEPGTYGGLSSYTRDASTLNKNYYLKHVVDNNIITESYACLLTDTERCLRAGEIIGGDYEPAAYSFESPFMEENMAVIASQNDWFVAHGGNCSDVSCSSDSLLFRTDESYLVVASNYHTDEGCGVDMEGSACVVN